MNEPAGATGYQPPPNGWRTFLIVWVTQSVSVFGSALTFFAVNIWLAQTLYPRPEQKSELAAALSAIALAFALPTVFGAPIAGAWADRHDRKRTMMAMDFANALLSLLLAALVINNALQLPLLVVLVAIQALFGVFHQSAFDTSYAMIVPEDKLPRANGMMQTIWALSGIVSPAIAAAMISVPALLRQSGVTGGVAQLRDGTPLVMGIDALTFFAASAVLAFLYVPSPKRGDLQAGDGTARKSLWADIREGALYIWHRRPLLWLLGTFTVANFVAGPLGVFQPLILKFNLAADWSSRGFTFETALALLASVGSVGGVAGGVFISAWGGLKRKRVYGVVVSLIAAGLALIVYGLSGALYLTAAMAFLDTAMIPIMNAHSQAIWQTQTPHELQGRVFAVRRLIAQFTWPLSTALAGWAGGAFNPGAVIAVLGGVLTLFCVGQLLNPYLMRVEDKAWLDEMAARRVAAGGQQANG
ncbi:MAG TPA: MFS transporter [Anaerolineae bacterium]|nr:MFS transporter [Anaerolineae bacterium]